MPELRAPFDSSVIQALARDLADDGLAYRFLSDYLALLEGRLQRIEVALENYDNEAAMDAILSLKIASSMVGAHDAADRCAVLQSLVAGGRFDRARREANELSTSACELASGAGALLTSLQTDPV